MDYVQTMSKQEIYEARKLQMDRIESLTRFWAAERWSKDHCVYKTEADVLEAIAHEMKETSVLFKDMARRARSGESQIVGGRE